MFRYQRYALISLIVLACLVGMLKFGPGRDLPRARTLHLACAAGVREPVTELIEQFERETGFVVQTRFAGSGTLLSELRISSSDLFLAADEGYLEDARKRDLVESIVPFARQHPVLVVAKGNPLGIESLDDLLRDDVRVVLPDPERAAIGRVVKLLVLPPDRWARIESSANVMRGTVNEVANDVKLGSVDVGIVWDATVAQYSELEVVEVAEFHKSDNVIAIAILKQAENRPAAEQFIQMLTDPNIGQTIFARYGYGTIDSPDEIGEVGP